MKPYDDMTHVLIEKAAGDAYVKAVSYPEEYYRTIVRAGTELWEITVNLITSKCMECSGTGAVDSGGVHPWGASILVPCEACDGSGKQTGHGGGL